jgi:hypothetical protein
MMAAHHIYREVKPDIFTNNRISSLLDTRKPSAEVIAEYVDCHHTLRDIPNRSVVLTPPKAHPTNMTTHMEWLPCQVICRPTILEVDMMAHQSKA